MVPTPIQVACPVNPAPSQLSLVLPLQMIASLAMLASIVPAEWNHVQIVHEEPFHLLDQRHVQSARWANLRTNQVLPLVCHVVLVHLQIEKVVGNVVPVRWVHLPLTAHHQNVFHVNRACFVMLVPASLCYFQKYKTSLRFN